MADNDQLLDKIGNLIDQKLEPIKKDMATKADVQRVEQGQVQIHTTLGQITTAVEALAAGQKDQATKTDIRLTFFSPADAEPRSRLPILQNHLVK
jgi:hypothetical protein